MFRKEFGKANVTQGRMTAVTAVNILGMSRRQVHCLLKDFQTDCLPAIRHKARGRRSNNRIDPAVREFAVTLVRENYIDIDPTFAAEKLTADDDLKVSRETLRKWMQGAGIWLSRNQRVIEDMLSTKISVRKICGHVSTISRDVKRNGYTCDKLPEVSTNLSD